MRNIEWGELQKIPLIFSVIGKLALSLRLGNRSRMSREVHVRCCEQLGGKFPGLTLLSIFVRSQKASERVKGSIGCFITEALKLKVNEDKSVVCECDQTKLLGYTIYRDGNLGVARESLQRLKIKIRGITKRNRGRSFEAIISELRPVLRGWLQYFRLSKSNRIMQDLDAWIRRKLRCYRIKQCKKVITLQRFLKKSGVATWQSWILALSGKGHWRKSGCPQVQQAMGLKWFEAQGLYNLALNHKLFNN